uniref:Uncharacterized protein n=1 Tax=Oryza meridionalis TaxID=40149 RepID=A0A0E0CPU4_9ORYZ
MRRLGAVVAARRRWQLGGGGGSTALRGGSAGLDAEADAVGVHGGGVRPNRAAAARLGGVARPMLALVSALPPPPPPPPPSLPPSPMARLGLDDRAARLPRCP